MLERIDAIDGEMRTLIDSLRSGASRVSADLALLQGSVGDLRGSGVTSFEAESSAPTPAAAAPGASAEPAIAAEDEVEMDDEPFEFEDEDDVPETVNGTAAEDGADRPADEEGARLI